MSGLLDIIKERDYISIMLNDKSIKKEYFFAVFNLDYPSLCGNWYIYKNVIWKMGVSHTTDLIFKVIKNDWGTMYKAIDYISYFKSRNILNEYITISLSPASFALWKDFLRVILYDECVSKAFISEAHKTFSEVFSKNSSYVMDETDYYDFKQRAKNPTVRRFHEWQQRFWK